MHEKDGGLHGWEYDTGSYTITVTVKEKDNALIAEKTVVKGDKKADKPVFTNTYDSSCEETVVVSGMKTWKHGSNPENKRPEAIIVKVYGDGQLLLQRQLTGKTKTAKTGDSSNLILWFVLMMISVIGMGVVFAGRKRN